MQIANLIGRGKTRISAKVSSLSTRVKIEKYEQRADCYRSKKIQEKYAVREDRMRCWCQN
jgi:hypothetical protein